MVHLSLVRITIPFRIQFNHNSATRSTTQTVIAVAQRSSYTGYGEGCPREYVTGESVQSCFVFFEAIRESLAQKVDNLESLRNFNEEFRNQIRANHACWCAIETAMLDLFAKEMQFTIEQLLGTNESHGMYQYSAVIGGGDLTYFKRVADAHCQMKFTDFKIKISGNAKEDFSKILYLKDICPDARIRLDANNLWETQAEVVDYCNGLPADIYALEEPLRKRDLSALFDVHKSIGLPIILDESFLYVETLDRVFEYPGAFIVNIRVSKMGGLLNCLQIAERAKQLNILCIVGAQVGECSILTRAAIVPATALGKNCVAMEGAYGTLLLEDDVVSPSWMFQEQGRLIKEDYQQPNSFGLELMVHEERLIKFS